MGFIWIYLLEVWRTLRRLGGVGLILMGLVDSSVIPTPGGLDALTIVLTAHERDEWIYYAVMATIGSVLGGYITYRLGRKGGERALARRFSEKKIEQVHRQVRGERHEHRGQDEHDDRCDVTAAIRVRRLPGLRGGFRIIARPEFGARPRAS